MIRTLFIIAGGATVLALGSLAGAAALGGGDLARNGYSWTFTEERDSDRIRIARGEPGRDRGPRVSRTESFTGGDRLILDAPIDVVFVQGETATVRLEGPQAALDRIRIDGARISVDEAQSDSVTLSWGPNGLDGWHVLDDVTITVTAPSVSAFQVSGSAELDIQAYDQPSLNLAIDGSGEVRATGRTERLEVDISGSGEAELNGLDARDADLDISGSGEIDARPTGSVAAAISGSGDIRLRRQPGQLSSSVSGSGEVRVDE